MRLTRFRGEDETRDAASAVSISKGLEAYHRAVRIKGRSCPHSLETMRFYYGDVFEDRMSLIETYGDGRTVYMLAPWTNDKDTLEDSIAHGICNNIISMVHVPFIGIWDFRGHVYEEPSFAVDHGISEAAVGRLLDKFGQRAAYRVAPDHAGVMGCGGLC